MKRQQIIIVVLAMLSIAGLYSLPRVVVDNDEDESEVTVESTIPDNGGISHSEALPEEVIPVIVKWKGDLLNGSEMTQNETALDSLMLVFQSVNKYDSAAYYAGLYAESFPEIDHWRKAGDAYYTAFSFAVDEAKSVQLSNQARGYYDKILDSGLNDLGVRNNLAMMLVSTSNPMQGVMMLREILAESPQNEQALFNMGVLSIESGQFERGLERFKSLVEYHPNNLEGNYWLAVCLYETGNKEEALAQFEKVRKMDSNPIVQNAVDEYLKRIK